MIQVPILISREAPSQKNVIWAKPDGDVYKLFINTGGEWKSAGGGGSITLEQLTQILNNYHTVEDFNSFTTELATMLQGITNNLGEKEPILSLMEFSLSDSSTNYNDYTNLRRYVRYINPLTSSFTQYLNKPNTSNLHSPFVMVLVIEVSTGGSVTFQSLDNTPIYYQEGYDASDGLIEFNCLFNGVEWLITSTKFETT